MVFDVLDSSMTMKNGSATLSPGSFDRGTAWVSHRLAARAGSQSSGRGSRPTGCRPIESRPIGSLPIGT